MDPPPRHFDNPYLGEDNGDNLTREMEGKSENLAFKKNVQQFIQEMLTKLNDGVQTGGLRGDKVYTGISGLSLLFLLLGDKYDIGNVDEYYYYKQALSYIQNPLSHQTGQTFSFLLGDSGPLAIAAVIYHKLRMESESRDCLRRLESMVSSVTCVSDSGIPDECLYGRAGYLYALLYVRDNLGPSSISDQSVDKVCEAILESGRKLSYEMKSRSPLMYEWHGKRYIGAAHGLSGIYTLLLQAGGSAVEKWLPVIRSSIDYVIGTVYSSGNFPSSVGRHSDDKLIHWCHGAPGVIYMLIEAYKKFEAKVYLDAALKCGEVIWERGLLRKGYGLCHGVSGNGYAFLALYQLTKEQRYLYRARKFASWCLNYGQHDCRTPDSPFSLFEGLAGMLYYMVDVLDPESAKFPAFSI